MKWAFVDYENVGSLAALKGSDYARVFVFCGPRNMKISFDEIRSDGYCRLELIRVKTMGNNNLDFHLAFYLGQYHESAEADIAFHIISNDQGFNGVINHIKQLGRTCKRVSTKPVTPAKTTPPPLSDPASLVVTRLQQLDGRTRPRKKAKFLNWIISQTKSLGNGVSPERVCKELVNAKLVEESGTDIKYHLES